MDQNKLLGFEGSPKSVFEFGKRSLAPRLEVVRPLFDAEFLADSDYAFRSVNFCFVDALDPFHLLEDSTIACPRCISLFFYLEL